MGTIPTKTTAAEKAYDDIRKRLDDANTVSQKTLGALETTIKSPETSKSEAIKENQKHHDELTESKKNLD
jgi:hypothetical protein